MARATASAGKKKQPQAPAAPSRVREQSYEAVELAQLKEHPRNANRGDLGALSDSIKANGFYGALIVQRSTGFVLAGNHRLRAARLAGLETVPVLWLDVPDEQALKILAVDNRVNRLGWDDPGLLRELLQSVPSLDGTGYDASDLEALVASLTTELPEMGGKSEFEQITFTMHEKQAAVVRQAIEGAVEAGKGKSRLSVNEAGNALHYICKQFVAAQKS